MSILAASKPDTPVAPSTAIGGTLSSPDVVVTWTEPTTNGSAISSYKIYFKKADGSYAQEQTNCDGSGATIVANKSCTIPKSVFSAAPFNLLNTDSVYSKITATNVIGESAESLSGNGALMATVSEPPKSLTNDAANTSHTQVSS